MQFIHYQYSNISAEMINTWKSFNSCL